MKKEDNFDKLMKRVAIFALIAFCLGISFLVRNYRVCNFRTGIICSNIFSMSDEEYEYYNKIYEKYTYSRLLFSFKPLKYEKWYTEEEVEFLKEHIKIERYNKFFINKEK